MNHELWVSFDLNCVSAPLQPPWSKKKLKMQLLWKKKKSIGFLFLGFSISAKDNLPVLILPLSQLSQIYRNRKQSQKFHFFKMLKLHSRHQEKHVPDRDVILEKIHKLPCTIFKSKREQRQSVCSPQWGFSFIKYRQWLSSPCEQNAALEEYRIPELCYQDDNNVGRVCVCWMKPRRWAGAL